jgi:hypothetical protein
MIQSSLDQLVNENHTGSQTQKTNLEESSYAQLEGQVSTIYKILAKSIYGVLMTLNLLFPYQKINYKKSTIFTIKKHLISTILVGIIKWSYDKFCRIFSLNIELTLVFIV